MKITYTILVEPREPIIGQESQVFDPFTINYPLSVKTDNDVNNLTQTAEIELPLKNIILPTRERQSIRYKDSDNIELLFGAKIKIFLGYNSISEQVFEGYFASFRLEKEKIVLELQDFMYYWKLMPKIQFSFDAISIKDLLEYMGFDKELPNTWDSRNILPFVLPKIRTEKYMTRAEVLQMLKEYYGFHFYYNRGKLFAGNKYKLIEPDIKTDNNRVYVFEYPYMDILNITGYNGTLQDNSFPIITNNISKKYVFENLKSIVTVTQTDNSKNIFYTENGVDIKTANDSSEIVGLEQGINIYRNLINLTADDATKIALDAYNNYPFNNYSGNFVTFGFPTMYPDDTILLSLNMSAARVESKDDLDSNYFLIEKVTRQLSISGGYKQTIYIDENYLSQFNKSYNAN